MSFLRHWEIYQSDGPLSERARLCRHASPIVLMSFQLAIPAGLLSSMARWLCQLLPIVRKTTALCQSPFLRWTRALRRCKNLIHFRPQRLLLMAGFEVNINGRF